MGCSTYLILHEVLCVLHDTCYGMIENSSTSQDQAVREVVAGVDAPLVTRHGVLHVLDPAGICCMCYITARYNTAK
jgi:hypothetical protein